MTGWRIRYRHPPVTAAVTLPSTLTRKCEAQKEANAYARDRSENRIRPPWRNMATSQTPKPQRRRPSVGDGPATGAANPPGTGPTPDHTTKLDTGHPNARGTLPMAHPSTPPTNTTASDDTPAGVSDADRALMRARLAAMAAPRDSDDAELAALRAVLRDEALMAHVTANVERWPPLTEQQRETIAALLNPPCRTPARRTPARRRAA
ncbi:hypothetical protein Prum_000040 [Phytohabitans rumicis]|uniref:Uncharacterized protein n=2 Tax=Phytohabitans rumicis TaxID=1076125 RepID=A0A6V8KMG3_9ACTN|nr:hypothetical protein Prum_000040 [Phytohabitans rumicis]